MSFSLPLEADSFTSPLLFSKIVWFSLCVDLSLSFPSLLSKNEAELHILFMFLSLSASNPLLAFFATIERFLEVDPDKGKKFDSPAKSLGLAFTATPNQFALVGLPKQAGGTRRVCVCTCVHIS